MQVRNSRKPNRSKVKNASDTSFLLTTRSAKNTKTRPQQITYKAVTNVLSNAVNVLNNANLSTIQSLLVKWHPAEFRSSLGIWSIRQRANPVTFGGLWYIEAYPLTFFLPCFQQKTCTKENCCRVNREWPQNDLPPANPSQWCEQQRLVWSNER